MLMPFSAGLTEDEIELWVEKATDRLDAKYMKGEMSEEEYIRESRKIDNWADRAYGQMGE